MHVLDCWLARVSEFYQFSIDSFSTQDTGFIAFLDTKLDVFFCFFFFFFFFAWQRFDFDYYVS